LRIAEGEKRREGKSGISRNNNPFFFFPSFYFRLVCQGRGKKEPEGDAMGLLRQGDREGKEMEIKIFLGGKG